MFDPLQLASQSSQLDPQHCSKPDTTLGAEGPRTPPHYSKMPASIPPFDLAQVGILPKMSPMTDQENALLNMVPGSPVMRTAPPGLGQGQSRSERSSCSGSPMSLGSPAGTMSLALALKVRTHPVMPTMFGRREELPRDHDEKEMDAAENDAREKEDWRQTTMHSPGQRALFGAPPGQTWRPVDLRLDSQCTLLVHCHIQ